MSLLLSRDSSRRLSLTSPLTPAKVVRAERVTADEDEDQSLAFLDDGLPDEDEFKAQTFKGELGIR